MSVGSVGWLSVLTAGLKSQRDLDGHAFIGLYSACSFWIIFDHTRGIIERAAFVSDSTSWPHEDTQTWAEWCANSFGYVCSSFSSLIWMPQSVWVYKKMCSHRTTTVWMQEIVCLNDDSWKWATLCAWNINTAFLIPLSGFSNRHHLHVATKTYIILPERARECTRAEELLNKWHGLLSSTTSSQRLTTLPCSSRQRTFSFQCESERERIYRNC